MAVVDEVLNDEAEFPLFGWAPAKPKIQTSVGGYVLIAEFIDIIAEDVELDIMGEVEA